MQPLISIIVPVYNVEKYLEKSIESLTGQTYKNLEILLMDDGSTDNSPAICDKLAQMDNRIKVIHKENTGVADTRNQALKLICGEYFSFIDSDDYVAPNYIEHLFYLITEYDSDIAECTYVFTYEDGKTKRTKNFDIPDSFTTVLSGEDAIYNLMYSKYVSPSSPCKLFNSKKASVNFPKMRIGEDLLAMVEAYKKSDKIAFSNMPLYYYIQHSASVMHSDNPDKIYEVIESAEKVLDIIGTDDKTLYSAYKYFITEKCFKAIMKLYPMENQKDRVSHIFSIIKNYRADVIKNKKAPSIVRVNCQMSYLGLKALYFIKNARAKAGG